MFHLYVLIPPFCFDWSWLALSQMHLKLWNKRRGSSLILRGVWVAIRLVMFWGVYTPPKISRTRHGINLKFTPVIALDNWSTKMVPFFCHVTFVYFTQCRRKHFGFGGGGKILVTPCRPIIVWAEGKLEHWHWLDYQKMNLR